MTKLSKTPLVLLVAAVLSAVFPGASTPAEAASPYWHCEGPVSACDSPKHPGATFGCAEAWGIGSTEPIARQDGAEDCARGLKRDHGGDFTCADASKMRCWKSKK